MHLAAFLLPFGSGSAPAAKGVITEMCPSSQRADALNAITLVENIARLMTMGLFGFIFAALADIGKAYITFFCNAVSCFLPPLRATLLGHRALTAIGGCCVGNGCSPVLPFPAPWELSG